MPALAFDLVAPLRYDLLDDPTLQPAADVRVAVPVVARDLERPARPSRRTHLLHHFDDASGVVRLARGVDRGGGNALTVNDQVELASPPASAAT